MMGNGGRIAANYATNLMAIILLLFCFNSRLHAEILPNSVHLQVHGTHQGSNIVYHYKVINNSDEPLQQFVVGSKYDNTKEYEYPQLERLPAGWAYGREGETGVEIILSDSGTNQPPYWKSHVYGQQETSLYYLEWETTPEGQAISPGQSLAGFTVTVPLFDNELFPPDYYNAGVSVAGWKENDIYLTGNFKVSYWDSSNNKLKNVWGTVEIADTTPPTLSISLSPDVLRKNEKYVPITATITVKDDLDPQPEINLVSITCNEAIEEGDIKVGKLFTDIRQFQLKADHEGKNHAGRIYTVTYIAIDGSGNQTMASATVTVPHDGRKHEERRDKDEKKDRDRKERH